MGLQVIVRDRDDESTVGVALIAGVLAHAVRHNTAWLRGCSHHKSAGAHAEAVDATAIAGVMHQLVLGGTEQRMTGAVTPASTIDQRLRVFDANADGKGFAFQCNTDPFEHLEGVSGRMSWRQYQLVASQMRAIAQPHTGELQWFLCRGRSWFDLQCINPASEAHFTAQRFNPCSQSPHHCGELESTDMGTVQREDLSVGTTGDKFLQHLPAVVGRITHLAVELSIGEGSCPPFSELRIGFRLKRRGSSPEAECIGTALLHWLPPLQQQRPKAHLSQQKGREIAAWASSDHNRAMLPTRFRGRWSLRDVVIALIGAATDPAILSTPTQESILSTHLHVHAVDQANPIATPSIDAAFHQMALEQAIPWNFQAAKNGPFQILLRVIKLQTKLAQPQHKSALPGRPS